MSVAAQLFILALFVAVANERLVQVLVKPWLDRLWPERSDWVTQLVALVTGILLTFGFGIDFITPVVLQLGVTPAIDITGAILSALVIGGGSGIVHEIVKILETVRGATVNRS